MKKILLLVALTVFLSGCATYKLQLGKKPYDKGYIVSRDDFIILEYTIGKDNNVPDLELARERFKKRRHTVEHYYKKMGYIENRFKMAFWDPCILSLKAVGGIFRLPFVAVSDYKYEHNPKYREKIKKKEQEQDAKEEARIQELKDELNIYIQKQLEGERS